ncbi:T9SS type A sorting domain-containing protein [Hymenobacter persicinus]|uniref:T9SS type A sorting domain-containing protein n=1 Tax=Hymenobacter persicinus TaxID=2025506 RepID=A0A4V1ZAJ7_9BACT|nr:T9SS type A sorting domain-containing protein [Hymenobacter persicinus]RYU78415.1 T9SS type A sorting domain-containing protein [Hymenobacter persicinus]
MGKTLLRAALLSIFVCFQAVRPGWAQEAKGPATDVGFYIVAHQDDWQLFMGSHAYDDVQRPRGKAVFVCLTAGQAYEPGENYWRAREAGCRASVQSLADAKTPPTSTPVSSTVRINGHTIAMMRYKNTSAYFLRLPDGNLQGQGFDRCNFQSLKKLRSGEGSITDVEGINTYTSWGDLSRTLRMIIQQESSTGKVWINTPDSEDKYNPRDHSDHQMAGRLAASATANTESCMLMYVGYDVAFRKTNLSPPQAAKQASVFSIYCQGLTNGGQATAWDPGHLRFMGRQYYRTRHSSGSAAVVRVNAITQANTGVEEADDAPEAETSLKLEPNYPNPFDQASMIVYHLPQAGFVTMRIYDLRGNVIKVLVQKEETAGRHEVWLEVDQFPASGQYICQIQAGGQHREQRLQISR